MKRLIVIDDDLPIQEVIELIFDPTEYKITFYSDGQAVLNNAFEHPDLFILDKQLSGADGLDICRFLKDQESTRHIPIVFLSASPNIYRLAKEAGAEDALAKPFNIHELREKVANLIAG